MDLEQVFDTFSGGGGRRHQGLAVEGGGAAGWVVRKGAPSEANSSLGARLFFLKKKINKGAPLFFCFLKGGSLHLTPPSDQAGPGQTRSQGGFFKEPFVSAVKGALSLERLHPP